LRLMLPASSPAFVGGGRGFSAGGVNQ